MERLPSRGRAIALAGALMLLLGLAVAFLVVDAGDGAGAGGEFHSPDAYPPASWRPFADTSPFNQQIPANPRIARRSTQIVRRLNRAGLNQGRVGVADTSKDFYKPIYYATDADPLYRITDSSTLGGRRIRMPAGARAAGGQDHHLTVIWNGYHYGFWNCLVDQRRRILHTAHRGEFCAARKTPLSGPGTGGDKAGAGVTAAGFANLAGTIRAQELAAGQIDHALFVTSSLIARSHVYPAVHSDGRRSARRGYPPMGTRIQLAVTPEQIDATGFPAWKKAVLRALALYGGYLGDTSDTATNALPFESGSGYTSFGRPDPIAAYAKAHLGQEISSSGGLYYFDLGDGVDWGRYLRVIAPCVTKSSC